MKKTLLTIGSALFAILFVTTATYAIGTLTPSGTAGDDTQYSLNDIYNKLVDFTASPSATSSPFAVPGSVSASFRTLSEIYGLLEAEEDDLVPENIADGVEIFGVEGTAVAGVVFPTEWSIDNSTYYNWEDAVSYCNGLVEGGHSDWRLPTYLELPYARITQNVTFANSDGYWSITQMQPTFTGAAYYMSSLNGTLTTAARSEATKRARCVR